MTMHSPKRSTAYKAELIHRPGPWRSFEAFATLEWVDWFNNRRLLEPIGTSRRPKPKHATMPCRKNRHGSVTQTKQPPAIPGAVHSAPCLSADSLELIAASSEKSLRLDALSDE